MTPTQHAWAVLSTLVGLALTAAAMVIEGLIAPGVPWLAVGVWVLLLLVLATLVTMEVGEQEGGE